MDLTDVEVAVKAAQAGADVVRRAYGSKHVRHVKGPTDFATEADVMAESAILATLTQHRPDDARTGEESGSSGGVGSTRRWLIDPLCGTLNFAATTPLVSVNVALSEAGRTTVAAVADPIADELFWTDAHHVWSTRAGTDQFVRPSVDSMLVEINCDGPIDRAFVGGQLVADARLRAVYGPRVVSSTLAVCWVAAGRRTAYVSDGSFRENVHFAAGIALCQASGCVVSDLAGNPLYSGRGLIAAADADTHQAIVEIVRPHLEAAQAKP